MTANPSLRIRRAANAGTFYPAEPRALASAVTSAIGEAGDDGPVPKALIAPHAGYIYSGRIAGAAFRRLRAARETITRVVLLGPSHRFRFEGIAATFASAYETPLGQVTVDREWLELAKDSPGLGFSDEAHEGDHALETHLPFLQQVLGDFSLIPFMCGRAETSQVATLLERVWGGPETIVVVSSDLSHFLDYESCTALDNGTRQAIEQLDHAAITFERACGAVPLKGLLNIAARRQMTVETLQMANSGDASGTRDRVVGYGAWALWEPASVPARNRTVADTHGALMNDIARRVILGHLVDRDTTAFPAALQQPGACFVTLHKNGTLRGCYGSIFAWRTLLEDLRANAENAALRDPRFPPLDRNEWDATTISVTLMTPLERLHIRDEDDLLSQLQPHLDGLVIEDDGKRSVFLPVVWSTLPNKRDFLEQLKLKAGLARTHWSAKFCAHRFRAIQTQEEPLCRI